LSKIALSGNASGSGTFTLAAPNSNSDRTLTLPDNTGTILTNATTAGFPAGSVLQVVNATYSTSTGTTSESYQETGLTASITPSNASNKIAVFGTINGVRTAAVNTGVRVALYKGTSSTILMVGQYFAAYDTASTDNQVNVPFFYLDSPNTTSSVTYGFAFYRSTGSGTVSVQTNSSTSSVTLMEIAA
jgi:hypothetical protein